MKWILVRSLQPHGLNELEVNVEVLVFKGLQHLAITGLPDAWLRDSKDKIKALLYRLGNWNPLLRIVAHLTPADIPKVGAHLEAPLVLGALLALENEDPDDLVIERLKNYRVIGAVDLQGQLLHTPVTQNFDLLGDPSILGPSQFETIQDLLEFIKTGSPHKFKKTLVAQLSSEAPAQLLPLDGDSKKREQLWIMAAALAEVPVLLLGAPGVGKSYLARWAYQFLPSPNQEEEARLRKLWSLAELPISKCPSLVNPYARSHLSDFVGVNRRGLSRPGHFSLAHKGLLILDEFPELARDCREVLRNVLDSKSLTRHSSQGSVEWPMDFWLIATANPCPCGYVVGRDQSQCTCRISDRSKYQSHMSGPILDRMGVILHVGKKAPLATIKKTTLILEKVFKKEGTRNEVILSLKQKQSHALHDAKKIIKSEKSKPHVQQRSERRWALDEKLLAALIAIDETQTSTWVDWLMSSEHRDHVLTQ